jgi:hypothetical protein
MVILNFLPATALPSGKMMLRHDTAFGITGAFLWQRGVRLQVAFRAGQSRAIKLATR